MLNHWYAIYVKSRAEKKTAERLELKGVEVYCPTTTVVRQWSDRKKKVKEPLFKSYLFVRINLKNQLAVLETPGVVALVKWLGKPAIVKDEEIQAIESFLNNYANVEVKNLKAEVGERVKVVEGLLRDRVGVIVEKTKNKVKLELEQLGLAIYAEVPLNTIALT